MLTSVLYLLHFEHLYVFRTRTLGFRVWYAGTVAVAKTATTTTSGPFIFFLFPNPEIYIVNNLVMMNEQFRHVCFLSLITDPTARKPNKMTRSRKHNKIGSQFVKI